MMKLEIDSLAAETLAIQAILIGVLSRLSAVAPEVKEAIGLGFDDAANYVEHLTIKLGDKASPAHTSKGLQIVEGLRATVMGEADEPKHAV